MSQVDRARRSIELNSGPVAPALPYRLRECGLKRSGSTQPVALVLIPADWRVAKCHRQRLPLTALNLAMAHAYERRLLVYGRRHLKTLPLKVALACCSGAVILRGIPVEGVTALMPTERNV